MQVIHQKVTRNRTIRAIPIAGNYPVRRPDGIIEWAEPNDAWSIYHNTGGNSQIICNIRRDDTEHSADLFLYSNLTLSDKRKPSTQNTAKKIIEENRLSLDPNRKWYIRQFMQIDRIACRRFTGLPLDSFFDLWRAPIDPQDIHMTMMGTGQFKFSYRQHEFPVYFVWPELQKEYMLTHNTSQRVLSWIQQYCKGKLFLFSDYDTIFEDEYDEFLYITDNC